MSRQGSHKSDRLITYLRSGRWGLATKCAAKGVGSAGVANEQQKGAKRAVSTPSTSTCIEKSQTNPRKVCSSTTVEERRSSR